MDQLALIILGVVFLVLIVAYANRKMGEKKS